MKETINNIKKENYDYVVKKHQEALANMNKIKSSANQPYCSGGEASSIIERYGTKEEILKFSHLADNAEFFLDSPNLVKNIGYTEGKKSDFKYNNILDKSGTGTSIGLCEYISITALFNYFQTTKKLQYFSKEQIENYYIKPYINKNIVYKYHIYNERIKAVPWEMWKNNKFVYDLKFREEMKTALKKWLPKSTWKSIKIGSSTSWMHSSSPEKWLIKYKVPVLFSFVVNNFSHNVVIYGYDEKTKEYAVSFGWEDFDYNKVILKKDKMWSYFSIGFWLAFKEK